MQRHRGDKAGLAWCSGADALPKLGVELAHIGGGAAGHIREHRGIHARDHQVFQDIPATDALETQAIMVGRFLGRDDARGDSLRSWTKGQARSPADRVREQHEQRSKERGAWAGCQ